MHAGLPDALLQPDDKIHTWRTAELELRSVLYVGADDRISVRVHIISTRNPNRQDQLSSRYRATENRNSLVIHAALELAIHRRTTDEEKPSPKQKSKRPQKQRIEKRNPPDPQ